MSRLYHSVVVGIIVAESTTMHNFKLRDIDCSTHELLWLMGSVDLRSKWIYAVKEFISSCET